MERRTSKNYAVVICLMVLTCVALETMPDAPAVSEADVNKALPDRVGDYVGIVRMFCHNPDCRRSVVPPDVVNPGNCPACGGALYPVSFAENETLPKDTVILKKEYVHPDGKTIAVSVVFSGADQRSIHRPQQCLPAQGWSMEKERTIEVPVEGRAPLRVRLIDVRANQHADLKAGFAYWFVGKGRETPSHLERLFWMSADRALHNRSQKWAYVAIMTLYSEDSEKDITDLKSFISNLYPLLKKEEE